MSKITNLPTLEEEKIDLTWGCIEHRATWMALTYEEMEKEGYDAEKVTRAAIKRCGNIHGWRIKGNCKDPNSIADFAEEFIPENIKKTFEMTVLQVDTDNLKIEFHYCPLVNAWEKLGIDDERIAKLCDMAMDGDRGISESMGIKFNLTDTIAKGCNTCKLHFYK